MLSREPGHRPDEPRPIRSQLHHPTEKRLNRRRDKQEPRGPLFKWRAPSSASPCLPGRALYPDAPWSARAPRLIPCTKSKMLSGLRFSSLKTVSMTFAVSDFEKPHLCKKLSRSSSLRATIRSRAAGSGSPDAVEQFDREAPRSDERGVGASPTQSPFGLRLRDQIRV